MSAVPMAPIDEQLDVVLHNQQQPGPAATGEYGLKFLAAAFGAMTASGVTNPFDIIKVRQQLRTQKPGATHNAFWAIGTQMVRNEGVLSLGGGFGASMMREFVYSGIRMGTYEFFKDKLHSATNGTLSREGVSLKVAAATISAAIGSSVANPADVIKVRMQAYYPEGKPYRHTPHAFVSVFKEGSVRRPDAPILGGLKTLYRGVEATTIRGVILTVSQVASYDHVKQTLKSRGIMREGAGLHFTSSLFAGFFCSVTSSPVDVVKVRLMTDKHHQFKGALDCARQVLLHEGPMAFYKGFSMCWGRLGTHTIVSFLVFERLRLLFGVGPL
ncbi:mitochondrial carrier [Cristinia sonorae]|uniref:Mitochondrial carrier n=1 Tax=Cristinia sonorae TaxID=1940300 RepID=A0A8K0XK72_9AGAR|nr:mitochondrial carrier [Cristinia sonorae]